MKIIFLYNGLPPLVPYLFGQRLIVKNSFNFIDEFVGRKEIDQKSVDAILNNFLDGRRSGSDHHASAAIASRKDQDKTKG